MRIVDSCDIPYIEKRNLDQIEKENGIITGIQIIQRIFYCPICDQKATIRVVVESDTIVKLN